MNKVCLIGRLVRDPELKFTPGTGTAVCTYTLAIDRKVANKDGKREADYINIVSWGKQGENVANYITKGKLIAVNGRMQVRSYEAKDKTKRYVTEIVSEEVQFLEKGNGKPSQNNSNQNYDFSEDMTPIDDGEIPF